MNLQGPGSTAPQWGPPVDPTDDLQSPPMREAINIIRHKIFPCVLLTIFSPEFTSTFSDIDEKANDISGGGFSNVFTMPDYQVIYKEIKERCLLIGCKRSGD